VGFGNEDLASNVRCLLLVPPRLVAAMDWLCTVQEAFELSEVPSDGAPSSKEGNQLQLELHKLLGVLASLGFLSVDPK